jgi:hypothetical protein
MRNQEPLSSSQYNQYECDSGLVRTYHRNCGSQRSSARFVVTVRSVRSLRRFFRPNLQWSAYFHVEVERLKPVRHQTGYKMQKQSDLRPRWRIRRIVGVHQAERPAYTSHARGHCNARRSTREAALSAPGSHHWS